MDGINIEAGRSIVGSSGTLELTATEINMEKQLSFGAAIDQIRMLDDQSFEQGSKETQFLEIRKGVTSEEVCVNGNLAGLVHFARLVLEVAGKGFVGAHQHFDEVGELDVCEVSMVISFKV